ncbi:unnamed protein product (mitochondrion) [Plasmodiophora brassicae]|uniref:Mic1 domain-containing protein n=1 Tax=Plasmodiophora brassicae TaxID=37360 RepID=A0A0G4ITD9_PLABS|nr:hypothetical protein PBRA_006611 [Plasmodiophora brassicae]SPQ95871.1 unnamed protein product [Plasmodiophora brassicae]
MVSHLSLTSCVPSGRPPRYVGVDDWSRQVVSVIDGLLAIWDDERSSSGVRLALDVDDDVRLAQRSRDGRLWAVLTGDNVLVVHDADAVVARHAVDGSRHRCLGLHWVDTDLADLAVVTTAAVCFFAVDAGHSALKLVRAQTRPAVAGAFLASHRLLMSIDPRNRFHLWSIGRQGPPKKVCRFEFGVVADVPPHQLAGQVHLVDLYAAPTLLLVDQAAGKLHVCAIEGSTMRQTNTFDLFATSAATFTVYVIDNVVAVLSSEHPRVPMLFDTRSATAPVVAPLPMQADLSPGRALPPDHVSLPDGSVRRLQLNLAAIADSRGMSDAGCLMAFLQRRRHSEADLLRLLSAVVQQERLTAALSRCLSLLSTCALLNGADDDPVPLPSGTRVAQADVAAALRQVLSVVSPRHLEAVCVEYVHCLLTHHVAPTAELVMLTVDTMLKGRRLGRLQQFVQFHIFPDSPVLAHRLCLLGASLHPPLLQLGLDMLSRLGWHDDVVGAILSKLSGDPDQGLLTAFRYVSTGSGSDLHKHGTSLRRLLSLATSADVPPAVLFDVHNYIVDHMRDALEVVSDEESQRLLLAAFARRFGGNYALSSHSH